MNSGNSSIPHKKKYYLLAFSVLLLGGLLIKVDDTKVRGPVYMEIFNNPTSLPLRKLNDFTNPAYADFQDQIWFKGEMTSSTTRELKDSHGTNYQVSEKFFINFITEMNLSSSQSKEIYFKTSADDGFILMIDEREIDAHDTPAGSESAQASMNLTPGDHIFKLRYRQQYGDMFVQAYYRTSASDEWKVIGKDSQDISFKRSQLKRFSVLEYQSDSRIIYSPRLIEAAKAAVKEKVFFTKSSPTQ